MVRNVLLLVIFILLASCAQEDSIRKDIIRLKSHPVRLDLSNMVCIEDDLDTLSHRKMTPCLLKLVVYLDSTKCSSCYVKTMYRWKEISSALSSYKGKIQSFFIFSPKSGQRESLYLAIKGAHLSMSVYVDTTNVFSRLNPHLPSDSELRTFLLDEKDSVILVGSPIKNKKMQDLFWKTVEGHLGKP